MKKNISFYQRRTIMSSTQEGTTLILASIAVCLMIYAMNQQYKSSTSNNYVLGSSMTLGSRFSNLKKRFRKFTNLGAKKTPSLLGKKRARVDPTIDCANVSPSDPNWQRCAQGAGVGRIPTRNARDSVANPQLAFEQESIKFQGLGSRGTRIQDSLVQDQFAADAITNLGKGLGGIRIDPSNLKNNGFFSQGTENASSARTSGLSAQGAMAFPFTQRSDGGADATHTGPSCSGNVPGTEAVGMGMSFAEFIKGAKPFEGRKQDRPMGKREVVDSQGRKSLSRSEFNTSVENQEVGNAFNPFTKTGKNLGAGVKISEAFTGKDLGAGVKISEAFTGMDLGAGSKISEAFTGMDLGSAVSPVSSDVGVSPQEISAATSSLDNVNIVQSTIGGQLNFGIRP